MTPELVHILATIYTQKTDEWKIFLERGGDDEGGALEALEQSLLALKILRRLLIVGYEFPNRDKEVGDLWLLLQVHWDDIRQITMAEKSTIARPVVKILSKILMQLSKLHLEMAEIHPAAFVHLPRSLALVRTYWQIVRDFGNLYRDLTQYLEDMELNPVEK